MTLKQKIRNRLELMKQEEQKNNQNVEKWKRLMTGAVVALVLDPDAGTVEKSTILAEDIPVVIGSNDVKSNPFEFPDDFRKMEYVLFYSNRLTASSVSVIGLNESYTGPVIIVKRENGELVSMTEPDVAQVKNKLWAVRKLNGQVYKVLTGCKFKG